MKDPAFLFYSSDFLSGTMLMSDEEIGQYIKLLCLQHQKGHLSEKDMLKICKTYNEDIFQKFKKDDEGNYYNQRLEEESIKRQKYSESRRNNRKKKESEEKEGNKKTYEKDMKNICNSYEQHMGNENENINENININKIKNENIIEIYNQYCTNLPKVKKTTKKREKAINSFLKEFTEEQFEEICKIANDTDFLIGKNNNGWKADFDFLMRTDKATNVLEGKYSNIKSDKMDGFIEMWKEAKNEEERNNSSNQFDGW